MLSGGHLRAVLARARRAGLPAAPRRTSVGAGCARDAPAGSGPLRGELDRFGGVTVRLARLDSLDVAAFQRGLQGKCAWPGPRASRASDERPARSARLSAEPGGGERARRAAPAAPLLSVPLAGRSRRRSGHMVTPRPLGSAALESGPLSRA